MITDPAEELHQQYRQYALLVDFDNRVAIIRKILGNKFANAYTKRAMMQNEWL